MGKNGGGVSVFDGQSITNYPSQGDPGYFPESGYGGWVSAILQDSRGNLWYGGWNEVRMYDGEYITVIDTTQIRGLKPVLSILEDSRGNIWFGS